MDITFPVGAPSAPLQMTLGGFTGNLVLHDNGDGTHTPRLVASDNSFMDIDNSVSYADTADGAIPANRLVKGHTDGTLIVGTLGSTRIIGVNNGDAASASGMSLNIGAGYVSVVAAEPIIPGDLLKCGDNGRVLQLHDTASEVIGTGTAGAFTNQPANDAIEVVSDDADDKGTATIIGTTHGGHTVMVETVTLKGLTEVATAKEDWGVVLAVKVDAHEGTVTVREASDDQTIIALATGTNSAGVVAVAAASQGSHGLIPYMKAAAASTKEVGILYQPATGAADAYGANALNGSTAAAFPAAANLVKEIYLGDVAAGTVATVYTNATVDDADVAVGKAVAAIAAGDTGVAYIRP